MKEVDIKGPVDSSKRIPAPDCRRQRITAQCMVEIVDGPFKSKVGTVIHVSKPYLWVQCTGVAKARLISPCHSTVRMSDVYFCFCLVLNTWAW